jgi:putative nucleotidyltransferase with HDIG domain
MTRDDAWNLLCEYTKGDSLRKHALAVETAVLAYARKFGEDEEKWGITALLHDFDYEMFPDPISPDGHPYKGNQILQEKGYPEDIRRAIMSHADYTGVTRESLLEKTLFACDELCGFITAVSYVRPSKSVKEVEVKSVRKKMKDKAFAAKVNRDDIIHGAQILQVDLDEHIGFVIKALQDNADALGL